MSIKKNKGKVVRDYLMIALGSALVAAALHFFCFPAKLAAGGISGLAIILEAVLQNVAPWITKPILLMFFNIVFFAIGFLFLGPIFGIKTIFASFFLTGVSEVLLRIFGEVVITNDIFLNTLYGTFLGAAGMVIVFNYGGSTGGTDILGKIMNKYLKTDLGKSIMVVDFLITLGGFFAFGPQVFLYSLLSAALNGSLIDRLLDGSKTAKEIMIISREHEAIRQFILTDLDRSCTVLKGYGGYTRAETEVLYVVLNRRDYIDLKDFIKEVDRRAFISVNEVREVLGEGYQDISLI